MEVVLVIHLFLALAIIGLVLLQRSEGGGLGIGGGGGMGGLTTPQGAANLLTRMTGFCAAGFFCTSLLLGILGRGESDAGQGILKVLQEDMPAAIEKVQEEGADIEVRLSDEPPSAPIAE